MQQNLKVTGLYPIDMLGMDELEKLGGFGVFLESKNGVRPFLNGENHLVWQDGEPIDPFILSVTTGTASAPKRVLSREIFNEGRSVEAMEPYHRLLTSRGPCGFDSFSNVPGWARTKETEAMFGRPGYPGSFLENRADGLAAMLVQALGAGEPTQAGVDTAISLAERLVRVTQPKSTTVNWLRFLLHYGHTVSGTFDSNADAGGLLAALGDKLGGKLVLGSADSRDASNGRWLVAYTKGLMDTDTLSDFIFGELYVPLSLKSGTPRFRRTWSFPKEMEAAILEYAVRFTAPFWAKFDVEGRVRTTQAFMKDGDPPVMIRETLTEESLGTYSYAVDPIDGVKQTGTFAVTTTADGCELSWTCGVEADKPEGATLRLALLAQTAAKIGDRLTMRFSPAA